ncbi:NADP-dependent oxidoreductase domain-containing protein [Aspergillus crustosus]
MEYARVGTSGLYVSKIILGAASYGSSKWQDWVLDEEDAFPLLEYAFKNGIKTHAYSNSNTIKRYSIPREQLVILMKIFYIIDPATHPPISAMIDKTKAYLMNRVGLSYKYILDTVAASIKRLDRDICPDEIMQALNDVVESGQVRYLGASLIAAWEFQKMQFIAERHRRYKFISMQNYYNLLLLARGVLAHVWEDWNIVQGGEENLVNERIVSRVEEVVKKRGVPIAMVALAWCLNKGVYLITGLGSWKRVD